MLLAREIKLADKASLLDMICEINDFDGNFEGLTNISNIENFDEFLKKLEKNKHQELIKPEYSPQATFFVFDENNKIIGGFNLRYTLKGDLINHGGNIGYLIRPTERQKGYGTQMLRLALSEAKKLGLDKVLISCRKENVASEKVILNNGGIYENDFYDEKMGKTFKRYWIQIK